MMVFIVRGVFIVLSSWKIVIDKSIYFDVLLVFYLVVSWVNVREYSVLLLWFEALFYFLFYISLKSVLSRIKKKELVTILNNSAILGTCVFALAFFIPLALFLSSGNVTTFGYKEFVCPVFFEYFSFFNSPINELYPQRSIMRNTFGEIFAFYLFAITVSRHSGIKTAVIFLVSLFFVFFSFSRRALIDSGVIVFSKLRGKYRIPLILFCLLVLMVGLGSSLRDTYRIVIDFDAIGESPRIEMYGQSIRDIQDNLFLGHGYAAKINTGGKDKYVHNFILNNLYMNGIIGGITSFLITGWCFYYWGRGLIKRSTFNYSTVLIIPLIGLMVGGTMESIFTVTGWLAIAVFQRQISSAI